MSIEKDYQKAWAVYQNGAQKARMGDKQAKVDKGQMMQEVRQIERAAAREGVHLDGGQVLARGDTKRSLQEAYARNFDDTREVLIHGKKTTMQRFHRERLLKR